MKAFTLERAWHDYFKTIGGGELVIIFRIFVLQHLLKIFRLSTNIINSHFEYNFHFIIVIIQELLNYVFHVMILLKLEEARLIKCSVFIWRGGGETI